MTGDVAPSTSLGVADGTTGPYLWRAMTRPMRMPPNAAPRWVSGETPSRAFTNQPWVQTRCAPDKVLWPEPNDFLMRATF